MSVWVRGLVLTAFRWGFADDRVRERRVSKAMGMSEPLKHCEHIVVVASDTLTVFRCACCSSTSPAWG